VLSFAPRIPSRLVRAVAELDDPDVPIAEVSRRVGARAEQLALPRPSYQRVRELVHESRLTCRDQPAAALVLDAGLGITAPIGFLARIVGLRGRASRATGRALVTLCYEIRMERR
jgi:hypothetical protein